MTETTALHRAPLSPFRVLMLRRSDIGEVIRIADEERLSPWSAADLLDELSLPTAITLRLASEDSACAGFLVGRRVPGTIAELDAELYNIGVDRRFQKRGGGGLLIEAFINECSRHRVTNIWLDVRVSNDNAIRFYSKYGFVEDGRRKRFYTDPNEDSLVMRLTLS